MMIVGIDAHKYTHTAVMIDAATGGQVATVTIEATPNGLARLVAWISTHTPPASQVRVGVEDCRHVTAHLEGALVAAGLDTRRVPPHATGASRRGMRQAGKSDTIDALAVARALNEHPDLPAADTDPVVADIAQLVRYRDQRVRARTSAINQLRWALVTIDPTFTTTDLTRPSGWTRVRDHLTNRTGPITQLAGRLVDDIETQTTSIRWAEHQLRPLITPLVPTVMAIDGIGLVGAATIIAHVGTDPARFATPAKFARYSGTAPVPAHSGTTTRHHRLDRGGNRQLNRVTHTAARTQARTGRTGRPYYDKKRAQGFTDKDATRSLKRHISTAIYHALLTDLPPPNLT